MKKKLLTLFAALAMAATVSAQVTYTCTAGTNFDGGEGVAKLFDNNVNTKFCGESGSDVYALVTASEPVYVWGYDITTANDNSVYGRLLKKWALYGTNDPTVAANPSAEGWVTLSDLGQNDMVQKKDFYTQRFFCENGANKPYKYFKLAIQKEGFIQFSEFKILGEPNRVVNYKWKASSQDNSKKAVDLLLNQKWEGSNLAGNWVTIETGDGQAYAVKSYSFSTHDDGNWPDRAPKSWKIEGSNDNSNWTLIDERTNDEEIQNTNYATFEFTPNNTTDKFRYIKLTLVSMKGTGWTQVGEFHVLSTSDVSDAQYYTNLVNAAKATKAEYEALLGATDPWCAEYNTFFEGLDLDAVLAAAISSGEYEALEAKLAQAENNAIAQALNQFINGANYAAIAGSADKCWGDGHYTQLFDGKDGCEGRPGSKWGGNNFPQYVIFRVKAAFKPFFYKLVTGNDTATSTGRNWKDWNVYGGNFATFAAATDSTTANWTLLDERTNISEEYLPMKNFYPATFDFNKGVSEEYLYYMVKVIAPHNGSQQQMSEMYLCTQEEFEAIRQPLVDDLSAFAAGLDALTVEASMESKKEEFKTLYAELQTTSDAVRLTKIYNDLVALKEALEDSSVFATGGFRAISGNLGDPNGGEAYPKLLDGKTNTKWCGSLPDGGAYVIFKTYAANAFNQYMLTTGNDTGNGGGARNWKSWKIYGASFASDADAISTSTEWTLIDEKSDIGQDRLPAANFAPAYFNFSTTWPGYTHFKILVESCYSGTLQQMAEFKFLSDAEYATIRQGLVTELTNMVLPLAGQFAALEISDEVKNQIMTAAQGKVNALANATADELLPTYNDALNYITVEAPTIAIAAQLAQEDGVYQLSKPNDLVNFATLVNLGNNDINAVLTKDIDMNGVNWPAAIGDWSSGNVSTAYKGHFDGQGHTIKNLVYTTAKNWHGLFGVLTSGAVVENFKINGTVTVASGNSSIGVVGFMRDANTTVRNVKSSMNINNNSAGARIGGIVGTIDVGTAKVDRCWYNGTLDGNDAGGSGNYGGIVGYFNNNSGAVGNITNCLFDGKVVNNNATPGNCTFGGIVGYNNGGKATVKNCLSIGTVTSNITGQFFGKLNGNNSTFVNCYYMGSFVNGNGSGGTASGDAPALVTEAQLATTEVVLNLGIAWRMNLGADAYPAPDANKSVITEITDAGYATLFVDNAEINIPEGVKAYTAELGSTDTYHYLTLTEVEGGVIPTATPVILKGNEGIYEFTVDAEETVPDDALKIHDTKVDAGTALAKQLANLQDNVLKGAADDIEATGKYILAKVDPETDRYGHSAAFCLADGGMIAAGKAYLELSGLDVKALHFIFPDDDPTGISTIANGQSTTGYEIYNLAGQRMSKMQKGINIVGNKKVLK